MRSPSIGRVQVCSPSITESEDREHAPTLPPLVYFAPDYSGSPMINTVSLGDVHSVVHVATRHEGGPAVRLYESLGFTARGVAPVPSATPTRVGLRIMWLDLTLGS